MILNLHNPDWESLSYASQLKLGGNGENITGSITGASKLNAFDYPVDQCDFVISGASSAKVDVSLNLKANVSGASMVIYRGNPQMDIQTSGASEVKHD